MTLFQVLEKVIDCPFLATMHYAFQTPEKLYLVLDFVQGGELFTHLFKIESFPEHQARIYIAEIIIALEQLHKVSWNIFGTFKMNVWEQILISARHNLSWH